MSTTTIAVPFSRVIYLTNTVSRFTNNVPDKSDLHIGLMRADGSLSNVIEKLSSSGEFCLIKQHHWHYRFEDKDRLCKLCGKHEEITAK